MAYKRKYTPVAERKKKPKYKMLTDHGTTTFATLPDKEPLPVDVDQKQLISQLNKVTKLALFLQEKVMDISAKVRADGLRKPLNKDIPEMVFELAQLGCSQHDIARILGIDQGSISAEYREVYDLGIGDTKMSLRRKQLQKAGVYEPDKNGDTTMLIWLGKQLLEQRDQPATQVNIQNNIDSSGLREKLKQALSIEPSSTAVTVVDVTPDDKNE